MREFVLTEEHIRLLRAAEIGWNDVEFGAPGIDPKRPYGSSGNGNYLEMIKILGMPPLDQYVRENGDDSGEKLTDRLYLLHRETETALQILLATGSWKPGTYVMARPHDRLSWQLVDPDDPDE